ncbi:peptidoglycan D,D-transpeptidase FtsI family protein [Tissierella creatinophila]|uniref:Stage V sporulation protein D n=1 Tax=Tissierella creatinophila DSM 6911 TaxID=1123403 RepID=A0A1U7M9F4_TISCR|nr:penicillin-binding transpeptidase domain-containing protein [Tissierella creatinophila]OLS03915.1 stage V sporulation protein D [Tissierella creatinophila DSM 6911]
MKKEDNNINKKRVIVFFIFIILSFLLLSFRLYYLQVLKGDEFTSKALNQRGKKIDLNPKRGIIFDKNLIPLTNNEKILTLIIPKDILKKPSVYDYIKTNTNLNSSELNEKLNSEDTLLKIPLKNNIDMSFLKENAFLVDVINRYNSDGLLSHVIGYINELDNKGESGIEKVYDEFLKTYEKDSFIVEYDRKMQMVLGGTYNVNHNYNPYDPSGVKLTIDSNIQRDIERIMDENKINGGIVVTEVESGEVLALASRPNFNPERIEEYFNDKDMALYNKTIQGKYPPGSIFKIVVLLAALEENPSIIDKNFFCEGFEEINGLKINCNNIHGLLSLKDGFANSCNSTFMQIAKEIGAEKIIEMSKRLGFGSKINIGLMEEVEGNLPETDELYGAAIGNIAIGQGSLEVTPLQVANLLTTVANGGINKKLTLVKGITNSEGKIIKEYFKEDDKRLISYNDANIVKEMLIEVVKSGTGKSMDLKFLGGAGGKTGSSQATYNGEETVHGWFSGFYPENNPKYVVTILIENASRGSVDALPIFKEIIKKLK